MPVLDTLRRSLLGEPSQPRTVRCTDCDADFSISDARSAVDLACPFCGSSDVDIRE